MLGIVMDILKASAGNFFFIWASHQLQLCAGAFGTLLETPNFYHYLSGEKTCALLPEIKERV
jgi:ABC-2 type transport system ATP-binding protein